MRRARLVCSPAAPGDAADGQRVPGEPALADDDLGVDLDALLAALVLVPGSFPRNRFFSLFRRPAARRVRRRAARIRSVIRDLTDVNDALDVELTAHDERSAVLCYRLAEPGVTRTTVLSPAELDLLRVALSRAIAAELMPHARQCALRAALALDDTAPAARVEALLARLLRSRDDGLGDNGGAGAAP